jgi:hypothetical protein
MMFNDRRKPVAAPAMSADGKSYKVSESVTVKAKRGKTLDGSSLTGAATAVRQNASVAPSSRRESRANARGLKAANAGSMATPEQQNVSDKNWRERHDVKQEAQYGTSSRPRYVGQTNWNRGDAYKDAAKAVEREQKKGK